MKILIIVTISVFATVAFGQEKIQPATAPLSTNPSQSAHGLVAPASAQMPQLIVSPIDAPRSDLRTAVEPTASGPHATPTPVEAPAAMPMTSRDRVTAVVAQPVKPLALPTSNAALTPVTGATPGPVPESAAKPRLAPQ